jgi:hypothetical protein
LPRGWEAARAKTVLDFPSCAAVSEETSVGATRLDDHRIAYLHEEGSLTGNRGTVRRIDTGTYESLGDGGGLWRVELSGALLCGQITLQNSRIILGDSAD